MNRLVSIFLTVLSLGVGGCLQKQFTHDGIALYRATVKLYTDQAMTNLIKAKRQRGLCAVGL